MRVQTDVTFTLSDKPLRKIPKDAFRTDVFTYDCASLIYSSFRTLVIDSEAKNLHRVCDKIEFLDRINILDFKQKLKIIDLIS